MIVLKNEFEDIEIPFIDNTGKQIIEVELQVEMEGFLKEEF